jgi:hypothetical protein
MVQRPRSPTLQPQVQSELELRKARYAQIEREADALGRVIGVRRLKLSEQARLTAMTPDLGGIDEIPNPEAPGTTMLVQQRAQFFLVAMVCEIGGDLIPFPRNRGELDAIYDRLDMEGMTAAAAAAMRIIVDTADTTENAEGGLDKAKNSSGMPGSE